MHYTRFNSDNILDDIIYRGEGNSSIVIALKNRGKIIRLLKKDGKIMKSSLHHHSREHPMRSIKFIHLIMKPLTEPFLSCATELIHLKSDFINVLSKNVEIYRPLHRLDKTLLLDDQYALVMDDLCAMPNHLIKQLELNDLCGPTLSVEIKPKQGFLPVHRAAIKSSLNDRLMTKLKNCCIYSSNQYLKLARGRISQTSDYCPINLFSGCPIKMKDALEELIHNPQNNLKVFKNLVLAYGESKQELKLSIILDEFFNNNNNSITINSNTNCNNNNFSQQRDPTNNLDATIDIDHNNNQTRFIEILIQCLLNEYSDYTNNPNIVGEEVVIDDKITNTSPIIVNDNENSFSNFSIINDAGCSQHKSKVYCENCDGLTSQSNQIKNPQQQQYHLNQNHYNGNINKSNNHKHKHLHKLPKSCVLYNVLKAQKLDTIGAYEALNMLNWLLDEASLKNNQSMKDGGEQKTIDILEELSKPQLPNGFGSLHKLADESKEDYYFRKVLEFLVSLTAKDCSIITTLRQITPGHHDKIISKSPHIRRHILKDKFSSNYYMFNVGIADLDQKMPLKIPRVCDNLNLILQDNLDNLINGNVNGTCKSRKILTSKAT